MHSRRTMASCWVREIDPESQNGIDESMNPQCDPPVIETSCDGPRRFAYIGLAVAGGTMVSCDPTTRRVAVRTPQGEQTAWVSATNVYHQTPQGWRLVLHHASPGAPRAPSDLSARPAVLH